MNEIVLYARRPNSFSVVFRVDCHPEGTQTMIATRNRTLSVRTAWMFNSLEDAVARGAECLSEWALSMAPSLYIKADHEIRNDFLRECEDILGVYSDLLQQLFDWANKHQITIPDKERWLLPPPPKRKGGQKNWEWAVQCFKIMQNNTGG